MSSSVQTRTYLRERNGRREFVEISWSGLDAELATGLVGDDDTEQVRERSFESKTELEEFVREEITKMEKSGFVESEPPPPPDSGLDVEAAAKKFGRTAYVPVCSVGEGPADRSRFGGAPWMANGAAWPTCGKCKAPMRFLVQLRGTEAPEEVRDVVGEGLIQLFACEGPCQKSDGGQPFSTAVEVREIHGVVGGLGTTPKGHRPYPPKRITGWKSQPDFPTYDDLLFELDDDVDQAMDLSEALEAKGHRPFDKEKVGGWPRWVQEAARPRCPTCRCTMEAAIQIISGGLLPIQLGEEGTGWVVRCGDCRVGTFLWQSE